MNILNEAVDALELSDENAETGAQTTTSDTGMMSSGSEAVEKEEAMSNTSIGAELEAEIAALKTQRQNKGGNDGRPSSQMLTSINTGIGGVGLVRVNDSRIDVNSLVHSIYARVEASKLPVCKYLVKFIPLPYTFYPDLDGFKQALIDCLSNGGGGMADSAVLPDPASSIGCFTNLIIPESCLPTPKPDVDIDAGADVDADADADTAQGIQIHKGPRCEPQGGEEPSAKRARAGDSGSDSKAPLTAQPESHAGLASVSGKSESTAGLASPSESEAKTETANTGETASTGAGAAGTDRAAAVIPFAMSFKRRNHTALEREVCQGILARMVGARGRVDYKQPQVLFHCECVRSVGLLGAPPQMVHFSEYNIRKFQDKICELEGDPV
jgi:hypothetical protein